MAQKGLEWIFKLLDEFSVPGATIAAVMKKLSTEMDTLSGKTKNMRVPGIDKGSGDKGTEALRQAADKAREITDSRNQMLLSRDRELSDRKRSLEDAAREASRSRAQAEVRQLIELENRRYNKLASLADYAALKERDRAAAKNAALQAAEARRDSARQASNLKSLQAAERGWANYASRVFKRQEATEERIRRLKVKTTLEEIKRSLASADAHGKAANRLWREADKASKRYFSGFAGIMRMGLQNSTGITSALGNTIANAISSGSNNGFNSMRAAGLATVAALVASIAALKGGLEAAFAVGKAATDAASFKQTAVATLDTFLGNAEESKKVYAQIFDFATKMSIPVKEAEQAFVKLLASGLKLGEVPVAMQGIADVASVSVQPLSEVFNGMVLGLSQIKNSGKMEGQDLNQILEKTGAAGVGLQAVFASVSKKTGMSIQAIRDAMQKGSRVESSLAIWAIFDAIATRTGGTEQKLGHLSLKLSKTINRMHAVLADRQFLVFRDFTETEGLQAYMGFLQNVVSLTDINTKEGMKFKQMMESFTNDAFKGVFSSFSGAEGKQNLSDIFDELMRIASVIRKAFDPAVFDMAKQTFRTLRPPLSGIFDLIVALIPVVAEVGTGFLMAWEPIGWIIWGIASGLARFLGIANSFGASVILFKALGVVLGVISIVMAAIALKATITAIAAMAIYWPFVLAGAAIMTIIGLISLLASKMGWLGEQGVGGWLSGFSDAGGAAHGAGTELVRKTEEGVADASETHSPSRLFNRYGRYGAQGYAQGIESGAPEVNRATQDLVAATQPGGAGKAKGGATGSKAEGGGIHLHIEAGAFQIPHLSGTPPEQVQEFLSLLSKHLPDMLTSALEQAALEAGV